MSLKKTPKTKKYSNAGKQNSCKIRWNFGHFQSKLLCCTLFLIDIQSSSLIAVFYFIQWLFSACVVTGTTNTTKNILLWLLCCTQLDRSTWWSNSAINVIENSEQQYTTEIGYMVQREFILVVEAGWDENMQLYKRHLKYSQSHLVPLTGSLCSSVIKMFCWA